MKKRLLTGALLAFAMLLLCNTKSSAQITGVDVVSFTDSSNGGCVLPSTVEMNFYGTITGTPALNDSIDVYVNFGDGSDANLRVPLVQQTYFYGWIPHIYMVPGVFTPTITASFGAYSDMETATAMVFTNTCAPLNGTMYEDANSNCVKDAGEAAIPYQLIKITNTTTSSVEYTATDMNGDYSYGVPVGFSYTIEPMVSTAITLTCPSTGSVTVAVTTGGSYTNDFGVECNNVSGTDVSVNGWAWNWRPGFNRPLAIFGYSNNWCLSVPATITLTLDPLLSYTSTIGTTTAPSSVSGNVLTWNITSLSALMSFYSDLDIYCDPSATMGDTICVDVTISTSPADSDPTNNSFTICAPVNNSMDPNQKSVFPKGEQEEGYIPNGTELTYIVDFQNTGNDIAYNVSIKDEIDSDLDINTIKILKTSHDMQPAVLPGNIMNFQFSGINLPDSGANEPASHGYVVYSIQPKANLANGTVIENTADIYFDSNPAIVTNTTKNTIGIPSGIQHISNGTLKASIFPNPASGNVYVEVEGQASFSAELYDMVGRTVVKSEGKDGKSVINVQSLSNGMYMMRLISSDNKTITTKINVQH